MPDPLRQSWSSATQEAERNGRDSMRCPELQRFFRVARRSSGIVADVDDEAVAA